MFLQGLVALTLRIVSQASFSAAQTLSIDPGSVSPIVRSGWCTSQEDVCSTLCNGETALNDCLISTLQVDCQCDGTFLQPNYELYQGSLPYFVCQEYIRQCVAGNSTDSGNQARCRAAYACPSLDPSAVSQTTSSPEDSQTPPPSPSPTPSPISSSSSVPQATGPTQPSGSSDSSTSTITEESLSARTSATSKQTTSTTAPGDSTDTLSTTQSSSPPSNSDSPLVPPSTGSKGLGTPAIVGIAVGVGVPVLLVALFLAYRLGGRRTYPPVPVPHSAFNKEYGGNEHLGGGNDPGIGFGNEVGGITGESYVPRRT
ncbi:hypothetical protein TWF281_005354 [Arthrobotrys megalospora]